MRNDTFDMQSNLFPDQVVARPVMPPARSYSAEDEIEVIDLDDPRGQIKPTTWHQ